MGISRLQAPAVGGGGDCQVIAAVAVEVALGHREDLAFEALGLGDRDRVSGRRAEVSGPVSEHHIDVDQRGVVQGGGGHAEGEIGMTVSVEIPNRSCGEEVIES